MQTEEKKIKVLQIAGGFRDNVNGKPVSGGIASFLYNYCTRVNTNKFHFDFMAIRNQCFESYRSEYESLGFSLYTLDIQSNGFKRFFVTIKKLRKFLIDNHYDAIHINIGAFFPVLACAIGAKRAGVKNIIAHSHSSGIYSKVKRTMIDILAPLLTLFADQYCACSLVAAKNLYSKSIVENKRYKIIRNAIDIEKFNYNEKVRDEVRIEVGYKDELVVGHIGRFVEVKNHDFLIDFFAEFVKRVPNSRLLLVGDGELRPKIEEKVKVLGLDKQVTFTGRQKNVQCYYQAMDIFVMPSYVEGLGIVAVEAQCTGLPCYLSTSITEEVIVTNLCKSFNLKEGAKSLAKNISEDVKEIKDREDASNQVTDAGYGLEENLSIFESLYI